MTPTEAAQAGTEALAAAWTAFTRAHFTPPEDAEPREHCWASGFKDCTRRLALDLAHPEIGRDFPDPAMEAMLRGREREASVDARLRQLAARSAPRFEVVEGQARFQIRGRSAAGGGADGRVIVTGKIDGRLAWRDGPLAGSRPIFECKSGRAIERCETLADLDRGAWTRSYADQLLLYLFARGEPWGLLILDRPQGPVFLPLALEEHLERVERRLQQAETAVACRLDGAPLPPYHQDPSECRRCPHLGKTCSPPLAGGQGLKALSDPSLIECAAIVAGNREAVKEYEAAKKRLGAAVRGNPQVLAGEYLVTGKWGRSSRYEFPPEVEARRSEEANAYRVEDPQGKWFMEVQPLAAEAP